MEIRRTFLHSKLARRIFWLFVLCALFPITILAIVSLRNVTAQLKEQSRIHLHQESRDEALAIFERLRFLEADMELVTSSVRGLSDRTTRAYSLGSTNLSSNFARGFKGLDIVSHGDHKTLFGESAPQIDFTKEQQATLQSGKTILSTIECNHQEPCIIMSRELTEGHPEQGLLVAELKGSYLWDVENLVQDMGLCVLDPSGKPLFCSAESPSTFPERATHSFSGEFEWGISGHEYLASYWNLPLQATFSATHWTIIGSMAKPDIVAPLACLIHEGGDFVRVESWSGEIGR